MLGCSMRASVGPLFHGFVNDPVFSPPMVPLDRRFLGLMLMLMLILVLVESLASCATMKYNSQLVGHSMIHVWGETGAAYSDTTESDRREEHRSVRVCRGMFVCCRSCYCDRRCNALYRTERCGIS